MFGFIKQELVGVRFKKLRNRKKDIVGIFGLTK